MLNKTGQIGNDVQWQKAVPPVPPIAPVTPAAAVLRQLNASDTTRFIQSAHVAEGLLYTEALRQAKEERTSEASAPAPQPPHPRSLADLPYLISPEYAAYRKSASVAAHQAPGKAAGSPKGQQRDKYAPTFDSTGLWIAAIFVALSVVVVIWVF